MAIVFSYRRFSWTLKLVLKGDWPELQKIIKTRLSTSLQKCGRSSELSDFVVPLIPLVSDPWESAPLTLVLNSEDISDDEGKGSNLYINIHSHCYLASYLSY